MTNDRNARELELRAQVRKYQNPRRALTRDGLLVPLNVMTEVDGGWEGFVLNGVGHAVLVFIPAND